jgi:hypothetical protein
MIRNIKILGLAFVAVMGMSSMSSSAAQAAPGEFHVATAQKANLTAQIIAGQKHQFQIGSVPISCSVANFESTVQGESPQITFNQVTVTPTYSACEFLGSGATVRMNGCQYKLVGTAELTAQLQVVNCTIGKKIELISAGGLCTITVGTQEPLSHVVFVNNSLEPKDIEAKVTVGLFVYERDGVLCPQGEGRLTGNTTVRAFIDNGTEQVTEHNHQFKKIKCGAQVGIFGT